MVGEDAFSEFERAGWRTGRAAPYARGVGGITALAIGPLLDAAAVAEGARVLDVATGPGDLAARAAERGARAVGVDFSEEMLALARARHGAVAGLSFELADAHQLPFADAAFDAVTAGFLLPHVADAPRLVSELARVLAPGGRVALSTWDAPSRTRFVGALSEAMAELGVSPPADLPPGPSFYQHAGDHEFQALLTGAGLIDTHVETLTFTHHIEDLDAFWADLLGGTVRTTVLVTSQSAEAQAQLRQTWGRILEVHRGPGGLEVPCSVKIGSGARA